DLLADGEFKALSEGLKSRVRKGTRLVPAKHGALDVTTLLGVGAAAEDDMGNRLSHHEMEGETQHDHDDFVTFVVSLGQTAGKDALLQRIETALISHDILRLKGFADLAGSASRLLIQAVGPRLDSYFDRPWKPGETRATELVVIGAKTMDRAAIERQLRG
ncbi:MAG: GTP-binding protein, partial [Rhizobiales bacterium]|nr:GTP-binding protein [Hyphomicrobiales bacterium]